MSAASWVDSHGHLYLHRSPPEPLLERAAHAGVAWILVPGIDLESSLAARALAYRHPDRLLWTAGLHPHEASAWPQQEGRLGALAVDAAAIGECGLDYYRNLSPPADQRAAFREQLRLAATLDKPVVVHCRDAFADVYDLLEEAALGGRAILHCWTGGPKWTKRFRELDVTFSFAGPVAFATGDTVRRGAAEAPPERSMVETDTPYLSPPPHRDEDNEPARIPLIGAALAEVWGIDVDDVARVTSATAARVLRGPVGG